MGKISLLRCARDIEVLLCWVFKTGRSLPAKHQSPSVPVSGYSCPRVTETTFPASVLASEPAWRVAIQHCEVSGLPCEFTQSNQHLHPRSHPQLLKMKYCPHWRASENSPKEKSRKPWPFTSNSLNHIRNRGGLDTLKKKKNLSPNNQLTSLKVGLKKKS